MPSMRHPPVDFRPPHSAFFVLLMQYATVNIYVLKADGSEVLTKRELTVSEQGCQIGG